MSEKQQHQDETHHHHRPDYGRLRNGEFAKQHSNPTFISNIVTFIFQALTDEQKTKLKEHYSICMAESGVSKEAMMKAKTGDYSGLDDKLKNFTFCTFKRIGIISEDGAIHKEVAIAKVEEKNREIVGKAVDACSGVTGTTLADKAWDFYVCYRKERPDIAVL